MEEWRPVVGYEGLYEVSDCGRVRTKARIGQSSYRGKPTVRLLSSKIKKTGLDVYGYPTVQLVKDKKERNLTVHKLVALAFLGPTPEGADVHHKDENKQNNRLDNLAYRDHGVHLSEHNRGRWLGSDNLQAVLTEGDVIRIKRLLRQGESAGSIARQFRVSRTTISHIKTEKSWSHVKEQICTNS